MEINIVPCADPLGPSVENSVPGIWLLHIPDSWSACPEKELAALRRTIASAVLEIASSVVALTVIAVEDITLCGLAGLLAARRVGAALVCELSDKNVIRDMFDDRAIPVLSACLRAAVAIVVPDAISASALRCFSDASASIVVGAKRKLCEPERFLSEVTCGTNVPWQRSNSGRLSVSRPVANGNEFAYVREVLESGWWGYGPVARRLEEWFVSDLGAAGAVATSSGTAALHLALEAMNLRSGDEVIVPALTFVSTAMAVTLSGGSPQFADIELNTLAVSAATIERCLSDRTRAVIVVHFAGVPTDITAIKAVLAPRGIPIIEDAAHALGASAGEQRVGTGSAFACFSFAPTKAIAAGGGGMLVFGDSALEPRLRQLSNVGLTTDTFERNERGDAAGNVVDSIGYRYRMDDITAAIAYAQIESRQAKRHHRANLVSRYRERLSQTTFCELLSLPAGTDPTWYIFPILVPTTVRNELRAALAKHGIDTSVHYPNLADQPFYRTEPATTPVAREISKRILSLPLHEGVAITDVDRVCDVVTAFATALNGREVPCRPY